MKAMHTARLLHFPEHAKMPESKLHLELRTALYLVLKLAFARQHSVGCDQFVYWDPQNPKRCLAPDAFIKLGQPDERFRTWKTWERGGPPELAVEIISENDARRWPNRLARYEAVGVKELVHFDPDAPVGAQLEVRDRVGDELVLRPIEGESTESRVLTGYRWVLGPFEELDLAVGLRLARADGTLLPTEVEAARLESEAARLENERLRAEIEALKKSRG
jgi:Uma2 family endonuclease